MIYKKLIRTMQVIFLLLHPLVINTTQVVQKNTDSQIVDIAKYAKPLSPDPITSAAPARYVLEVPAGFSDSHGITETDHVRWQRVENGSMP